MHRLIVAFLALLTAVTFACRSDVRVGAAGGSEPSSPEHTPCTQASDGDPCDPAVEKKCFAECSDCDVACLDGRWSVSCGIVAGGCPDVAPAAGSPCDPLCDRQCGPYTIDTPCGMSETVLAECTSVGWSYATSCETACQDLGDALSCNAQNGCVWMVDCNGAVDARCLQYPPLWGNCSLVTCAPDYVCVQMTVNPDDFGSGSCDGAASSLVFCEKEI
jgi:hypothetical protein